MSSREPMTASDTDDRANSGQSRPSHGGAQSANGETNGRLQGHQAAAPIDENPSRLIDSAVSDTSGRGPTASTDLEHEDLAAGEVIELGRIVAPTDHDADGTHFERGRGHASSGGDDAQKRSSTPGHGRAMTTVSSSATLCHLSDDEGEYFGRHKTKESADQTPFAPIPEGVSTAATASPPAAASSSTARNGQNVSNTATASAAPAPPIPAPDVVAYFDPASAGGGGPLARITTQQRERAEAEARERAERAHREAMGLPITPVGEGFTGGGILNRFRSGSMSSMNSTKRRARFITPLLHHEEETHSRSSMGTGATYRPTLTPSLSANTLADTPGASSDGGKDVKWSEQNPPSEERQEEYVYPDGGYGWVVVVCCMALAGCSMGQGMNYGAYQSHYTKVAFPNASSAYVGIVGTINAFCLNAAAFFFGRMGDRFGYKRILYISGFVAWLGMFIASFCNTLWLLLIFQGILGGIGQGMAMPLFMSLPSQWFYRKRGLASGLALSGAGLGGGISILIVRELLERFGYKRTLLIMSFINAFFCFLAVFFIKTRPASPEASGGGRGPWVQTEVLKKSGFWSISISLVVATLGYGQVWIYLQQWVELELPNVDPTLTVIPATLVSFFLVLGRALIGLVADHLGPLNTYALVFICSGIVQFALWLTAKSFAQICVFGAVYGIVAPGFLGLVPQIVVQLFGPANLASNVGVLILFNGPGNMAGAPLAGAIYDASGRTTFKWVIVVDGVLQVTGGIIALWAKFKASRRPFAKV